MLTFVVISFLSIVMMIEDKHSSTTTGDRSNPSFKRHFRRIRCWGLLKFFFAVLPTIVFGLFTIIFSLQQDAAARATRDQDQRQADETNRRIMFKEYIDDMKELLLDEQFHTNMNRSLVQMRIQTLTVLRHLDPARKLDLIRFLYENDLLRHDKTPTLDLSEADLSNMRFVRTAAKFCSLDYLYLPGIYAENITFHGCSLQQAVFAKADMPGATFISCYMLQSNFSGANLTRARFWNDYLFSANFSGASLTQSSLKNLVAEGLDLVNTDFYQSDADDRFFNPMKYDAIQPNEIINSRYPDGSLSAIASSNLVQGNAQSFCHLNTTTAWRSPLTGLPVRIIRTHEIPQSEALAPPDSCFFLVDQRQMIGEAVVFWQHSLLIDLDEIMFNFSAWVGLTNVSEHDEMEIGIRFMSEKGSFDHTSTITKSIKKNDLFRQHSIVRKIPPSTRQVYISFECDANSTEGQFCFFDRVNFSLFASKDVA